MATLDQYFNPAINSNPALRYRSYQQVLIAQQFTPSVSAAIHSVDLKLKIYNAPSGNVWVEIWSDNGSNIPNAKIGDISSTLNAATITTAYLTYTFTFSTNIPNLTSGTKYWIVFNGNYAFSVSYNVSLGIQSAGGYSGGTLKYYDGSSWATYNEDAWFNEYYSPASGPANLKSYNTNLKANIKTINTNPIANVKTLNTNV